MCSRMHLSLFFPAPDEAPGAYLKEAPLQVPLSSSSRKYLIIGCPLYLSGLQYVQAQILSVFEAPCARQQASGITPFQQQQQQHIALSLLKLRIDSSFLFQPDL